MIVGIVHEEKKHRAPEWTVNDNNTQYSQEESLQEHYMRCQL